MKGIISVIVGLIVFYLIFFQIDPAIVNWIVSKVPESAGDWIGLIEIGVWIVTLAWTIGLGLWLSGVIATIAYVILDKN